MPLRRYVPSGRGGAAAILATLFGAVVAGVAAGLMEGVVDRWISLFLIFPALVGAAAGGVAWWIIGRMRLRAPALALLAGVVGGATGYVATHAVDYLRFRAELGAQIKAEDGTLTDAELDTQIDDALEHEMGHGGVRGWLSLAAKAGVSIKHAGSSHDSGPTLTGDAAWALWIVELLIAAGIAGGMAWNRAREPFCEACNGWYGADYIVAKGGTGIKRDAPAITRALEAGDLPGAAVAFSATPRRDSRFILNMRTCPRCTEDHQCVLSHVVDRGRKSTHVVLSKWMHTRDEATRFATELAKADADARR